MDRCPKCSCPAAGGRHRCAAGGAVLGAVAVRVDGSRVVTAVPARPEGRRAAGSLLDRIGAASRRRVPVAEVGLFVVLGALVASLTVAVVT